MGRGEEMGKGLAAITWISIWPEPSQSPALYTPSPRDENARALVECCPHQPTEERAPVPPRRRRRCRRQRKMAAVT